MMMGCVGDEQMMLGMNEWKEGLGKMGSGS